MGMANAPWQFSCFLLITFASLSQAFEDGTEKGLQYGFYDRTCPEAEAIVRRVVRKNHLNNRDLPAGLIRIYFHDCFVRGCDASILLERSPDGSDVEKFSVINGKTLVGTEVIDEAKTILESECPETVSCADIVAFAARDAVGLAGLPPYRLPGGRRDGGRSDANKVVADLPFPSYGIDGLTASFAKKGLSQDEMVVLSGAHSIGGAHCPTFAYRLYNSTDHLAMDYEFASVLKESCPNIDYFKLGEMGEKLPFDMRSGRVLDVSYYKALMNGRGLLASDQALMKNRRTARLVKQLARRPAQWAERFAEAMVKLGAVDVLVGPQGEVRRDCKSVN